MEKKGPFQLEKTQSIFKTMQTKIIKKKIILIKLLAKYIKKKVIF